MKSAIRLVVSSALVLAACSGATEPAASVSSTTTTSATPSTTTTTTTEGVVDPGRTAQDGDTVAVDYTGTLDSGEEFDSSAGREPLTFVIGSGQVIPGFDEAVRGLAVGESRTVRIEPADAYGERTDELILEFPVENAPEGLEVGDQVQLGNGAPAVVIEVTDTTVTVDANHPLAGQALTFEVTLVSIG